MKRNWKKILLQWGCPLAVLLVLFTFLFGSFAKALSRSIANTFEEELISTVEPYGARLEKELVEMETVGNVIADIAFGEYGTNKAIVRILNSCVNETSLYEAVVCRPDGSALTHDGNTINLTEAGYYEWSTGLADTAYHFVNDDGITGKKALLLAIPSTDRTQRVILYYPATKLESVIAMSKEFDGEAFAAILDKKGSVVVSTDTDTPFLKSASFWNNIDDDCKVEVSQTKRAITEGKSGCVHLRADDEARAVVYVSVGSWTLAVGVDEAYVQRMQILSGKDLIRGLHQIIFAVIFGVVLIAVVNYVVSLTELKGTKQLKEKADTDQLTGLGNKLSTERRIKEYIAENPDSLAMMFVLDIDNFKKINDTMGHAFGDEVLRELGRQIGVNFRVTDIIGRTGGDEFTIFLKNLKDDSNTIREAQKLEYFFRHFQVGDYVKYSATASIGAAVFPADGADFETLYKAADTALYKAKERGKNQLAFYDDREKQS